MAQGLEGRRARTVTFVDEWRLLEAALAWLGDVGYRLTDSRGPEGMNQGFHVYAGERVAVRVIADRGQWEVEVRPDPNGADAYSSGDWFSLEAWSVCLGAPILFHVQSDDWAYVSARSWRLAPQLEFLRANLEAIEAASSRERIFETRAALSLAQRDLSAFPPKAD